MNIASKVKFVFYLFVILIVLSSTVVDAEGSENNKIKVQTFNIPAQMLNDALVEFAFQSKINIAGLTNVLNGVKSKSLVGEYEPLQALDELLKGAGFTYRLVGERSVSILGIVENQTEKRIKEVDSRTVLEEVLITGIKRQLSLQDAPVAMTRIGEESIVLNQVQDLRNVSAIVPGLEFVSTGPQASVLVQLRGVGTTNITEIADGPVSIHIDGVYSPRSQGVATLLHDVEQVEVLRGPQGTLFGRNSSSGSINVYNKRPSLDDESLELKVGFGNYQQRTLGTVMNWAVSDEFSVRFSGVIQQHDPYTQLLDNYAGLGPHYPAAASQLDEFDRALDLSQQGLDNEKKDSWRLSALWKPSDRLNWYFGFERYQDNSAGISELDPTLVDQGIRGVVLDSKPFIDLTNDVLRSQLDYQFDNGITMSYLFGGSEMTRSQLHDTDHGRTGDFEVERTQESKFRFYSHELYFKSNNTGPFHWIVGAFVARELNSILFSVDQQNVGGGRVINPTPSWVSGQPGAGAFYAIQPERRANSLGVYSQISYDVHESGRFTVGGRYNKDTKIDVGGRAINCRVPSNFGPYRDPNGLGDSGPSNQQIYAEPRVQAAIDRGDFFDGGSNFGINNEPCWIRQVNDIEISWHDTSGLLRYDHDLNQNTLFYGSVATGFKAGHIQDAGNTANPETVLSYELGLKSTLFSGALKLNTALFHADYKDLQFSGDDRIDNNRDGVPDAGGSTIVRNASDATVRGIELEALWLLSDYDHLQATATVLDAHFGRFDIPDSLFGDLFNPYSDSIATHA